MLRLTFTSVPYVTVTSAEYGTRELQDWDCVESLDLSLLQSTLQHVKDHGTLPPDTFSKEDQNSVGDSHVSADILAQYHDEVRAWLASIPGAGTSNTVRSVTIWIVDGFLLYPDPAARSPAAAQSPSRSQLAQLHHLTSTLFDVKLFLLSTRDQTLSRRAGRSGYVTLEGFWMDPPGYVEDIVWPNYARNHSWMFVDRDVSTNTIDPDRVAAAGIEVAPGEGQLGMKELLDWGVETLKKRIKSAFEAES